MSIYENPKFCDFEHLCGYREVERETLLDAMSWCLEKLMAGEVVDQKRVGILLRCYRSRWSPRHEAAKNRQVLAFED